MRVDRGRLAWGVILVVAGALPLAVSVGLIDAASVRQAWQLWPLVLVGLGVGILLDRTRWAVAGVVIVALWVGAAGGGFLAGVGGGALVGIGCSGDPDGQGVTSGTLVGPTTVTIETGCGDLDLTTTPGSAWQASGRSADHLRVTADAGHLSIHPTGETFGRGGPALSIALPADQPLDLHLRTGVGDLTAVLPGAHLAGLQADVSLGQGSLDLGGATLTGTLDANFSLGSADLTLPLGSYDGTVTTSFGSLDLCVPEGEAVHLATHSSFGSQDADDGFQQVEDGWQTTDYATATHRADVRVTSSFGSISITRGNCTS